MLVWAWESAPRCAGIPAGTDNCFCAGDTAKFCLCAFSDCGHISSPAAATVSWFYRKQSPWTKSWWKMSDDKCLMERNVSTYRHKKKVTEKYYI